MTKKTPRTTAAPDWLYFPYMIAVAFVVWLGKLTGLWGKDTKKD